MAMQSPLASSKTDEESGAWVEVRRVRFIESTNDVAAERIVRRFTQPKPFCTVIEPLGTDALKSGTHWPEPFDTLDLMLTDNGPTDAETSTAEDWMRPSAQNGAQQTVVLRCGANQVRWRPGRAWIQGPAEFREAIVTAVIDFSFFERELRALELLLPALESQADRDASIAFDIGPKVKPEFPRLMQTIQQVARLRMVYARLAPELVKGSRWLTRGGRAVFSRLKNRTDIPARLEAFSDRLEVCEDLYEGAADRITDYGWWHGGHQLELIIVILLVVEALLMAGELILHR